MDQALRRRMFALYALFLVPGVSIATWVTRTPDVRDAVGASTAQMGLILFGLSVGSMIGVLGSGALVARIGTRSVVGAGMVGVLASLPTIGLGAHLGSGAVVTLGLAMFGLGMGTAEVAMNVEGAVVEQLLGRPFMPGLHGCFSLGTVIGAALGIAGTAARVPVALHLSVVALVGVGVAVWAVIGLPAGVGVTERTARRVPLRHRPRPDSRLLLIGVVILALALAEGAANDWLPLLMVDGHGLDAAYGSAVYALFALAMTIGRFAGNGAVARFGRVRTLAASAVAGALGLTLVVFANNPWVAAAAVLLWGIGASLGFPLVMSAAGDSGPDAASRVSFVATLGYVAFLVGPPALGFLGEHFSLRIAMIVPLTLVAIALLVVRAVGEPPAPAPVDEPVVAEPA